MSRAPRIERPRGTHDVLPAEQPLWRHVSAEIERLCALYGYRPITTPVFEDTALFERTSGAGSDVVQKEMYTFSDRSDRSLTLRPEATAPICRAYVEHGLHREPQPAKLFTIASMYRYGAPGKGRYREHWQASVEAIGSDDPSVDAELIQLYDALLGRLGVTKYHLDVNSIGCRECRPAYLEALRAWLEANLGRLDEADARESCGEPAARLRQLRGEAGSRAGRARRGAEDRRVALRRVRRALRRRSARPRRSGSPLPPRADARPRARLLLAHDLGVRRPPRERERDALGGRTLRLPRRGDRRAADARRGLRGGHRAGDPRDGGRRRRRCRSAGDRRLLRLRGGRAARAGRGAGSPSCGRAASRRTPTTPGDRSRASSRRRAEAARRRSWWSSAEAATLRRAGERGRRPVPHDALLDRLSP